MIVHLDLAIRILEGDIRLKVSTYCYLHCLNIIIIIHLHIFAQR